MSKMPRRAFPADAQTEHVVKAITSDALASGGKAPNASLSESKVRPEEEEDEKKIVTKLFIPLTKAVADKRMITGVVLVPEQVDAHGDIYDADVIAKAAHDFLAGYNAGNEVALMHKDFKRDFDLLESYVAPVDFALGDTSVKAGTWIITVRVNEDKIWDKVKKGEITGFSIGGKAKVKQLKE
jgi:DNA adenine methylase